MLPIAMKICLNKAPNLHLLSQLTQLKHFDPNRVVQITAKYRNNNSSSDEVAHNYCAWPLLAVTDYQQHAWNHLVPSIYQHMSLCCPHDKVTIELQHCSAKMPHCCKGITQWQSTPMDPSYYDELEHLDIYGNISTPSGRVMGCPLESQLGPLLCTVLLTNNLL